MGFGKGYPTVNKSGQIRKFQAEKEEKIKRHTDAKSLSIAVSSAFNGAAQLATAMVQVGAIKPAKYWETQEKLYKEYLERFISAQQVEAEEFSNKVARVVERKQSNLEDVQRDENFLL